MRRRKFLALASGAAAAWPLGSHARAPHIYRMAAVSPADAYDVFSFSAFFQALEPLGFVRGHNLEVQYFSGQRQRESYAELATQVVRTNPNLILVSSNVMARRLIEATRTIPIIGFVAYPIASDLIRSLARHRGNLTGIVFDAGLDIWAQRFQLWKEIIPAAHRVGFLAPRRVRDGIGPLYHKAAAQVGIKILDPSIENPRADIAFRSAFAAMVHANADAIVVSDAAETHVKRHVIVDLAAETKLPAMYANQAFIELGGLLVFAADVRELGRHAARQAVEILEGANAGDIPFYQATKLNLTINLSTAKGLGLEMPASVIARADEVIE